MSTLPIAYPPSRPVRPHASRPQTRSMPPSAPRPLLVACLLLLLLSVRAADAGPLAAEFLYPNFTASSYAYIDTDGAFLESSYGAFRAAIQSPGKQQHQQPASFFYLVVLHAPSGKPVWAANRDAPTGPSGRVQLTPRRLAVTDTDGRKVLWSTPTPLPSPVAALRLRDDGDLQLLDARNATLWQSFGSPTDTLLTGQQLRAGGYLSSPRSSEDFSQGDYRLAVVAASDVALTWQGSTYWRVSNDLRSFKDLNAAVAAVSFNASGLHAVAADGALVFRVDLAPAAGFRVLKLGHDGRLRVTSYAMVNSSAPLGLGGDGFVAPAGDCDLPLQCPSLGLCAAAAAGNSSTCTCPPLFAASATVPGGCTPGDGSALASPAADSCRGDYSSGAPVSYLALKSQIAYFATRFDPPTVTGVKNAACRALCTANCTCLGYFHDGSSRSCYLIGGKQLGSLYSNTRATALGYMKTFNSAASDANRKRKPSSANHILPIVLPSIAAFLLVVLVAWLWRRRRRSKSGKKSKNSAGKQLNLGHQNSRPRDASYDEDPDDEDVVIPGMPARFTYAEIASMTESFGTKVGAGGFGSVYKGELPGGGGLVAVKKLEAVGVQARREFCTEIAVIGSIRHVNLVRLRGFCAEGRRRLLVYEYMNRGSLDRPLFGSSAGPALEWGERMEVALGAARGLAYLHDGCDQKIVHCDVKPENILLADGGQVKISDFGLAKLVPPEHSAIFTTMRGTRGYLAPEWLGSAAISDRADVYSFGMVLLELVHGRKNRGEQTNYVDADVAADFRSGSSSVMTSTTSGGTGSGCGGDDYFPMVALELHEQGRYLDLVDARLEGRVSEGEVARAVRVALCCLHEDPAQRPSMAAVVRALEGSAPPPEPRVEALGFLRLYGRGYGATLPATSGSASDAAHRGSASTTTPGWLNESSHDTDTSVPS